MVFNQRKNASRFDQIDHSDQTYRPDRFVHSVHSDAQNESHHEVVAASRREPTDADSGPEHLTFSAVKQHPSFLRNNLKRILLVFLVFVIAACSQTADLRNNEQAETINNAHTIESTADTPTAAKFSTNTSTVNTSTANTLTANTSVTHADQESFSADSTDCIAPAKELQQAVVKLTNAAPVSYTHLTLPTKA